MENASERHPNWLRILVIGRRPRATVVRIVVLIVTCFVTFKFVLQPIRVEGVSMLPTYRDRQVSCVNRLAYFFHEPRRGDVISIRFTGQSVLLMKRIIGLPGETVAFHNGHVYINGKLLEEPYRKNPCVWEHDPVQCGPDEYYVVGDNRSMPFEWHYQGRVSRERIIGKVLL
jgi:signal peptidase I